MSVDFETMQRVLAPLLLRLEVAEQKAEEWQAKAQAAADKENQLRRESADKENELRRQMFAKDRAEITERFRVNIATELMATSRQWAIEMTFAASGDDFFRMLSRKCLRAAEILLEEAQPQNVAVAIKTGLGGDLEQG